MSKNPPKVSIIVPVYNAENFLIECLKSLKAQSYKNIEIIVVDDGSSDNSLKIAGPFCDKIIIQKHQGAGFARNRGAENATGDVLAFTDADCIAPSNWILNIVNNLGQKEVFCCGGGYALMIKEDSSAIEKFISFELYFRRINIPKYTHTLVSNNFACTRDIFFKAGAFPEDYFRASSEDMVLSYNISKLSKIIWDHNNPVIHRHRSNISSYLKQQYVFSTDAVSMYLKHPTLTKAKNHHGKKLYLEIIITTTFVISLMITLFSPKALIVSLITFLLMFLINFFLIKEFVTRQEYKTLILSFAIIPLRNLIWIIGIFAGTLSLLTDKRFSRGP